MKKIAFIAAFCLSLLFLLGLAGHYDLESEKLVTLQQLHNVEQQMLQDNFSNKELDSMYLEYNYYYLKSYYENNFK